ncbi:SRPBCC family protein [Plantactinospora veratri]|uniref:SRPBCC family protein n=1 Tax=Plantactinospora veratri TaxID=1436122 RepID=UPI0038B68E6C
MTIRRPVPEVFAFYRDLENRARFLGDVISVERVGRAGYRWTIQGPLGIRLRSTVRLTEVRTDALIRYETTAPPWLRTHWTVHFTPAPDQGGTAVREVLTMPLGDLGHTVLTLPASRPPRNWPRTSAGSSRCWRRGSSPTPSTRCRANSTGDPEADPPVVTGARQAPARATAGTNRSSPPYGTRATRTAAARPPWPPG